MTITVCGPGRCTECSFHVATQGHRDGCSGTAPLYELRRPDDIPEEMRELARYFLPEWTDNFIENLRIEAQRTAEPNHAARRPITPTASAQPGANPAYVEAAIRAEMQRLANAREGTRNDTLLRAACNVFEFVKGGHADNPTAHAELRRIATAIGLQQNEIRATLRSAWERVGPRDVPPAHTRSAVP